MEEVDGGPFSQRGNLKDHGGVDTDFRKVGELRSGKGKRSTLVVIRRGPWRSGGPRFRGTVIINNQEKHGKNWTSPSVLLTTVGSKKDPYTEGSQPFPSRSTCLPVNRRPHFMNVMVQ